MGLWSRIKLIVGMKANRALDRAEDPRQVLDYALVQQQGLLMKVKQGVIEVATSKHQLRQQAEKLRVRVPQLEDQAMRALASGREDLARMALQRKRTSLDELDGLERQLAEMEQEEERLTLGHQQLAGRIEEFRTRREVMVARYTAAEAQVRVNEALTGVSGELAELSMAIGRAEEKTDRMLARASAIDALIDSGSLPAPGGGDLIERELRQLESGKAVEDELAGLRRELRAGKGPPALTSGA
jgi:phage shock protein A